MASTFGILRMLTFTFVLSRCQGHQWWKRLWRGWPGDSTRVCLRGSACAGVCLERRALAFKYWFGPESKPVGCRTCRILPGSAGGRAWLPTHDTPWGQ